MCGIVAYAGKQPCRDILISGIKKLEYRGYDSCGYTTFVDGELEEYGRFIGAPSKAFDGVKTRMSNEGDGFTSWYSNVSSPKATIGLSHTRWATHGKVSLLNTHPVVGGKIKCKSIEELNNRKNVYVVHNGIIENHQEKKDKLKKNDFWFITDTDTAVLANALAFHIPTGSTSDEVDLLDAIDNTIRELKGDYAFMAYHEAWRNYLFGFTNNSPLMVTKDGMIASDPVAFSGHAKKYAVVPKNNIVLIKMMPGYETPVIKFYDINNPETAFPPCFIFEVPVGVEYTKDEPIPLMLQEIREQATPNPEPYNIQFPMVQRQFFEGLNIYKSHEFIFGNDICLFGCGSSYNAALVGRNYLEAEGIPTRVEYATELPLRKNDFKNTWYIALTQSGETKDTLDAINYLKNNGATISVITNNAHSQAARLATPILLRVGPERAVAATKTFTEQCVKLYELGYAYKTSLMKNKGGEIESINEPIKLLLKKEREIENLAKFANSWKNYLFLARGQLYPIALEGALKVKEVAYKHAEAVHASEMKHGPIALIDKHTLSLFLLNCNDQSAFERVCSNIEEIKARGGQIIAITDEDSQERVRAMIDGPVISVPTLRDFRSPLVINVVLQLLAYYLAMINGLNVDRPRSLCKSVTV